MLEKWAVRLEPKAVRVPMITIAISEAISAYSMAVAPLSSVISFFILANTGTPRIMQLYPHEVSCKKYPAPKDAPEKFKHLKLGLHLVTPE